MKSLGPALETLAGQLLPVDDSVPSLPGSSRAEHRLVLSEQLSNNIALDLPWATLKPRAQQKPLDERLLAHELAIARTIQQSLLPKNFPALRSLDFGGFCQSARQVGGDFYDVLLLTPEKVLLVVADVMGKGVPAALFAATLRTLIRSTVEWTQCPAEILARINRILFDELSTVDMFITAQVAVADAATAQLTVANAGHCPLLLTDSRAQCTSISPEGMPLGIAPDVSFPEQTLSLKGCRFALLYTDGLTEARNELGEPFGDQRLITWLCENVANLGPASLLTKNFLAHLRGFQAAAPVRDDQTFLLLASQPPSVD